MIVYKSREFRLDNHEQLLIHLIRAGKLYEAQEVLTYIKPAEYVPSTALSAAIKKAACAAACQGFLALACDILKRAGMGLSGEIVEAVINETLSPGSKYKNYALTIYEQFGSYLERAQHESVIKMVAARSSVAEASLFLNTGQAKGYLREVDYILL